MRTGCWAAWAKHKTFGFCGLPTARPLTSADSLALQDTTVSQYPRLVAFRTQSGVDVC